MKKSRLLLATLALPLDYLMLVLAGMLAYQVRFVAALQEIRPVIFVLPFTSYVQVLAAVALVWLALFALAGLYSLNHYLKFSQEVGKLFLASTAGLALIVLVFFFNPAFFSSRFIVLAGWLFGFGLTLAGRLFLRWCRTSLYRRGVGVSHVLLIGDDAASGALEQLFRQSPGLGFRVTRRLSSQDTGRLADYSAGIDEVILGDPQVSREVSLKVLEFTLSHHLGFKYAADMFEAQSHNVVVHTLAGLPLIEIKRTPLDGWGRILKRGFDIAVALLGLIILSPVFAILAWLVYVDSGRPIFVGLRRVGEAGEEFALYKFRSMVRNARELKVGLSAFNERSDGPLFKMTNDPRVTRVGRFLRRSSLDELPQLWNVIRGQMSLVGPRPHEPEEVLQYQMHHRKLLNIKPGITGLAQTSGRSHLPFEDEVKLDTFYVENWSLGTDVVILIKTLVVVWQREAAV